MIAYKKLVPGAEVVSEAWPKLGTTDFTSHITKAVCPTSRTCWSASVWGGDYVAFYKQALRYGMFDKMKVATTIAFGGRRTPSARTIPKACSPACHANYYFTHPGERRWPLNDAFVERYFKRWNEYPNFQSDGAYTTLYMLKARDREGQPARRRLARR